MRMQAPSTLKSDLFNRFVTRCINERSPGRMAVRPSKDTVLAIGSTALPRPLSLSNRAAACRYCFTQALLAGTIILPYDNVKIHFEDKFMYRGKSLQHQAVHSLCTCNLYSARSRDSNINNVFASRSNSDSSAERGCSEASSALGRHHRKPRRPKVGCTGAPA